MSAEMNDGKKYLSVEQFAHLAHYSSRRVRQLIKSGKITAFQVTERGKYLIPEEECEKLRNRQVNEIKSIVRDIAENLEPENKQISIQSSSPQEYKSLEPAETPLSHEPTVRYDRDRLSDSDKILDETDLSNLLDALRTNHAYEQRDFQKVLRWLSFFNPRSNGYYDPDVRKACEGLRHSLEELIIFMKLDFVKDRQDYLYRLSYDDSLGLLEETLSYKEDRLLKLLETVKQHHEEYRLEVTRNLGL